MRWQLVLLFKSSFHFNRGYLLVIPQRIHFVEQNRFQETLLSTLLDKIWDVVSKVGNYGGA
jgi:hypothetical protein